MSYFPRKSVFVLGAVLGFGLAAAPAQAQNIEDPQIKVEFGQPTQGARRAFELEDGVKTKGRLQLGPEAVRLEIEDEAKATVVRNEDGKIRGAEVGFSMSTRITVPVKPGERPPTAQEVQQAVEELNRKPIFLADLSASARATTEGVGASVDGSLGERPEVVAGRVGGVRVNLGLVIVTVVSGGAVTEGGAAVNGSVAFDVNWKQGSATMAIAGGANLPKALSGKGLAGGVIIKIEYNKAFGEAVMKAVRVVREQLQKLVNGFVRAGRKIKDITTGFKGPTTNSTAPRAKIELGEPVNLSGASKKDIAARFAPVFYQHMSKKDPKHDQIRAVNYDGDWFTLNNWDNSSKPGVDNTPVVYFDVKETASHYFVTYAIYHARRSGNVVQRHENDLAGVMIMARKGAKAGAEIELVIGTRGNSSMATYASRDARKVWDRRDIDCGDDTRKVIRRKDVRFIDEQGPLLDRARTHPQLWVTKRDHNIWAFNGRDDRNAFSGKPGVIYHPKCDVRAPRLPNDTVGYTLLPLCELDKIETKKGEDRLRGNEGLRNDAARLPSGWRHGLLERGELFKDPAGSIAKLFDASTIPGFSTTYVGDAKGIASKLD